jgi:hypothetical protein
MGAKFQNQELKWLGEKLDISLSRYDSKITKGKAEFVTKELAKYMEDKVQGKRKDAAGDL